MPIMVTCSLDSVKKSSKKKETEIEKKIVQVLQQATDRRKRTRNLKIGVMKFLALTFYFFIGSINTDFNFRFYFYWLFIWCQLWEGN